MTRQCVPLKEYYRFIGSAFLGDIEVDLATNRHVALLGPRNAGKSIVMEELVARAGRRATDPMVVRMIWHDFAQGSWREQVQRFAEVLGTDAMDTLDGERPRRHFFRVCTAAARHHRRPIWVLVQDILGFPALFAQELLACFAICSEDAELRDRIAVVVSGSEEFIHLTYGSASPFRHARRYLVAGMDPEYAKVFYSSRRAGRPFVPAETHDECHRYITDAGFRHLYQQTGGQAFLIQEAVVCASRHPALGTPLAADGGRWDIEDTKRVLGHFLREGVSASHYVQLLLDGAERDPCCFELLQRVRREGDGVVGWSDAWPHPLEVNGLLRRDSEDRMHVAAPLWRQVGEQRYSLPGSVADVCALQGRWRDAWPLYEKAGSSSSRRAVSASTQDRFSRVVHEFRDSLAEKAVGGVADLVGHLFNGMRHLFGFEVTTLFDLASRRVMQSSLVVDESERVAVRRWRPLPGEELAWSSKVCSTYLSGPTRSDLWSVLTAAPEPGPCPGPALHLGRSPTDKAVDTSDQALLKKVLEAFWECYCRASRIEHTTATESIQQRHLAVIEAVNGLLADEPVNLGTVIRGTADALVKRGGYHRVLLSLVDAKRERIQGVASACADREHDFDFATDFALVDGTTRRPLDPATGELDVQQYVALTGERAIVPDAVHPANLPFTTQQGPAAHLGMKAIAVVPIRFGAHVLGTIHFERPDLGLAQPAELDLVVLLAKQLGLILSHVQRNNMLELSVNALTDRIRIVGPDRTVLFLNQAATEEPCFHGVRPGWQTNQIACECTRCKQGGAVCLMEEANARKANAAERLVWHYDLSEELGGEDVRLTDRLMAPIDDFRAELRGCFKGANARIGYVERCHDLTPVYQLMVAMQGWFSHRDLRATAQRVLSFLEARGSAWGRIYLLGKEAATGGRVLKSLEQFGMKRPENVARFRNGEHILQCEGARAYGQNYHVLSQVKQLAIYEYRAGLGKDQVVPGESYCGIRRFATTSGMRQRDRRLLEKRDRIWIEAPLILGDLEIGKITFAMPEDRRLLPASWELLRIAFLAAAAAIHSAMQAAEKEAREHAEHEAYEQRIKLQAWRDLSARAAHRIGNQLFAARGVLRRLGRSRDAAVGQACEQLGESVRRILQIVDEFQTFSSNLPPSPTMCYLPRIIQAELDRFRAMDTGLRISARMPREFPGSLMDADQIAQVLTELLENAVHHTPRRGRICVGLRLTERGKEPHARLTVTNSGGGVAEEDRQKVFDAFFTRRPGGTGLGLAIVKQTIENHGGQVRETGRTGQFARFEVELPIRTSTE